jgi:tetratricopeptide (TPR) repeat protein
MVYKPKQFSAKYLILAAAIALGPSGTAQVHVPFYSDNGWLKLADEQYDQNLPLFAGASAENYLQGRKPMFLNGNPLLETERALFYSRLSDLKINTPGAAGEAKQYIAGSADPAYRQRMAFALAQYYFTTGNWGEAITYYNDAQIANLSNREIADAKFELAYCYFNNQDFDKSEALFASIREIPGKYYNSGNYYYGLLSYHNGRYEEALKSFNRIAELKEYRSVVPYYIAEIYYFRGEKNRALTLARELMARPDKLYYDNELHLLAAQCLFEEKKFPEALTYFEYYYAHADKIRKEDVYKMGFSYYQLRNWDKAIPQFRELSSAQDSLGQMAMYLLGDCYLKTGDKKDARNAFAICADMPFNAGLQEASLLLAGKLSFEAGYATEGTARLKRLLQDFPGSAYHDEARTVLSEQLLKANNYSQAYELLTDAGFRDNRTYRLLLQKAAYGYGIQQMQRGNNSDARRLFQESIKYAADNSYEAAASFWAAELAYKTGNYSEVLEMDKSYLDKSTGDRNAVAAISGAATPQHAYMTMGYAAMRLEQYDKAKSYFSQSQQAQQVKGFSAQSAAEAALREADAAFMQKDYPTAMALYNKALTVGNSDADYVRYQKSVLLGLQGKPAEKEALLKTIVQQKPVSKYLNEARYQLGDLYLEQDKYADAITQLQYLTDPVKTPQWASKAWLKIALAYQESDQDAQAINAYKTIVTQYPSSEQRNTALEALRNLYVSSNQPTAYVQLLKDNNIATGDDNSLDSVFYAAAEAQYASGKYDKAAEAMGNYLKQYPAGMFAMKAHFYKAESHIQNKEYADALKDYDYVLAREWSDFTEPAAKNAAAVAYAKAYYPEAEHYYGVLRNNAIEKNNVLTAYKGLMLSSFSQDKFAAAEGYADTLLALPETDESSRQEIALVKGKVALQAKDYAKAAPFFEQAALSRNPDIAAEAVYRQAGILLAQDKLKEAEAAAGKAIQQTSSNVYWNVKSYLLMADVFIKQKDFFNARATLQSVLKNSNNEALKKEAAQKLEEVKQLEKSKSKLSD